MSKAAEKRDEPSATLCAGALLGVTPLITRLIQEASKDAAGVPLTLPQFRVLGAIADRAGGSLAELAQTVGVSAPSLSVMIMRLEKAGLVEKERAKREVRLTLTSEGQASYGRCIAALVSALADRLGSLTKSERHAILTTADGLQRVLS